MNSVSAASPCDVVDAGSWAQTPAAWLGLQLAFQSSTEHYSTVDTALVCKIRQFFSVAFKEAKACNFLAFYIAWLQNLLFVGYYTS